MIRETLLMMGFTVIAGFAFAYLLKLLSLFFLLVNKKDELPVLIHRGKVWMRAYDMHTSHIGRAIHEAKEGMPRRDPRAETVSAMNKLMEYHGGKSSRYQYEDNDQEMKSLYEYYHGKI